MKKSTFLLLLFLNLFIYISSTDIKLGSGKSFEERLKEEDLDNMQYIVQCPSINKKFSIQKGGGEITKEGENEKNLKKKPSKISTNSIIHHSPFSISSVE